MQPRPGVREIGIQSNLHIAKWHEETMAGKTVLFLYSRKKSKEDFFQQTHPYYCTFLYEMLFFLCQGGLTAVTNNPKFQLHKIIKIYFLITKIWCRCSLLDSSPCWLHDSAIKDSSCLWRCQFQNMTSKVTREGGKIMGKTYQIHNQLHTQVSSKMSTYILLVRSSHTPSPTDRCKGMGIYSVWLGSHFPAPLCTGETFGGQLTFPTSSRYISQECIVVIE